MEFYSFAKINIGLRVVGKRKDGFHNIETFFQQIDVHDALTIEPTFDGVIHISCSDMKCPADESNLAYRAADLLHRKIGAPDLGCRIHINKYIPMGGGLGGGSSNAATTLVALNTLYDTKLPTEALLNLALRLGSDVPFFIKGGFALGQGRGEILTAIPIKLDYFGILICPDIHISTAYVYNNLNLNLTNSNNFTNFSGFIPKINDTLRWKEILDNDLSTVVFKEFPRFSQVVQSLYDLGAFYAQMSGSGSSLFGLFETENQALKAKDFFKSEYKALFFRPVF